MGVMLEKRTQGRKEPRVATLLSMLIAGAFFTAAAPLDSRGSEVTGLLHITLERSIPAGDSTVVGPVEEVRLFFSGAPIMRGASVRVVDSGRKLVRTTPPAAEAADPTQLFVGIDPGLTAGTYVVQWRCIADDGHVMRGSFTFEVTGE
jgi:methionine-rich copper-binding protein CopC